MSQRVKGVIMRNLCDTVFYMKTNELQKIFISVSLIVCKIIHPWRMLIIKGYKL